MSGSTIGKNFTITTWGESHGKALGVVIDGAPSGLNLTEEDIQEYLDRRKPGQSKITTQRAEGDLVKILSGVFEDKTTGAPISLMVENTSQRSHDYSEIMNSYRPGHADYTFDEKFGFRDYRGGGRSSGRETIGRVAAGAIACKLLKELGVEVHAFTRSIGNIKLENDVLDIDYELAKTTTTAIPCINTDKKALEYLEECINDYDSSGGIVECHITGVPAGIGNPVFDKLDANLAKAVMSIGAVKSVEIGDGLLATTSKGSINNDCFEMNGEKVTKKTNHSGGTLGGISDGDMIILRAGFKPTPSIFKPQDTISKNHENMSLTIKGRHDPIIVPRAVVVVECMCALTVLDLMMDHTSDRVEYLKKFYGK